MITQHQQHQQQRSQSWNDMPYAALQLIADYHCIQASDALLVVGCVCKRWHDAAVNYLPADAWRRFYDHLVKVHYQIPNWQIAEAKLPTPDTLQAFSNVARHWQPLIDDARALRETFRDVEDIPDSWKMHALGTVAGWKGVTVENGRVTRVQLTWISLQGSVDLTKLPAGLQLLQLGGNQLSGSIDLTQLPASLRTLALNNNQFSGSVNLTQLPVCLQNLFLQDNELSGSVDLTQLPAELQSLGINGNKLCGSIDLTHLPVGLQQLCLHANNTLSGSVDLTKLSASLRSLYLNENQFNGSVDLTRLPASLVALYLHANKFSGLINLTQLPEGMQQLWLTNNKFEGSTSVNNKKCVVFVDDTVKITT